MILCYTWNFLENLMTCNENFITGYMMLWNFHYMAAVMKFYDQGSEIFITI